MAQIASSRTVHTNLNYYLLPSDGGTTIFYPGTAGNYRRKHDPHAVDITDVRGSEHAFKLDIHGFQVGNHPLSEKRFEDEEVIKSVAYNETAELLKKITGASRVNVFSHIVRNQAWDSTLEAGKELGDRETQATRTSARFIHVDQSYVGAEEVLRDNLSPEEAEKLGKTRWGIINVWRPIQQTVHREPLAICDARSVLERDLYPVRAQLPSKGSGSFEDVSKGGTFETWQLKANPSHRWYYASELTEDEALLIKCYDSKLDGRARRAPHTAFATDDDYGPPRQSIEIRCLVFWEDEELE